MSSLRKQESKNVAFKVDSRLRGNDKLCYKWERKNGK